ncbi:MAG: hypothetical protein ABEJ78_03645 [Haloferacaceae archaeon]
MYHSLHPPSAVDGELHVLPGFAVQLVAVLRLQQVDVTSALRAMLDPKRGGIDLGADLLRAALTEAAVESADPSHTDADDVV